MDRCPGVWESCVAGQKAPPGAVRAPDKFNSFVCLWPGKDYTFGRGSENLHMTGMDAWFPWGGKEWSASIERINFQVLVDDGKIKGLYKWIELGEWETIKADSDYEPLICNGYSPLIVHNILGKSEIRYLRGWTCYDGKETEHDKWTVQRSSVLCRLKPGRDQHKPKEWRNVQVLHPGKVTQQHLRTMSVCRASERYRNDTNNPMPVQIGLQYLSEEGQSWQTNGEAASSDLETVIAAEQVIRQLAESDQALGRALYGSSRFDVQRVKVAKQRSYIVPPKCEVQIAVNVSKQECRLGCQAKETIYSADGRVLISRTINGQWYGVTTTEIKTDITEKSLLNA